MLAVGSRRFLPCPPQRQPWAADPSPTPGWAGSSLTEVFLVLAVGGLDSALWLAGMCCGRPGQQGLWGLASDKGHCGRLSQATRHSPKLLRSAQECSRTQGSGEHAGGHTGQRTEVTGLRWSSFKGICKLSAGSRF